MGMFDWLTIAEDVELPEWPTNARRDRFQTKDFRCELDQLSISKGRRFLCPVLVEGQWELSPFTGDIRAVESTPDEWFEYRISFRDGWLSSVVRIKK